MSSLVPCFQLKKPSPDLTPNLPAVTMFTNKGQGAYLSVPKPSCKTFSIAKKIIAVSKVMENDLEALGCPKYKIVYNPCAPDNAFYNIG